MAEILNASAIHNNGNTELIVGIRGNQFKLVREKDSNEVKLIDPKTNKLLQLKSDISAEDIVTALGFVPIKQSEMEAYVNQAIADALRD